MTTEEFAERIKIDHPTLTAPPCPCCAPPEPHGVPGSSSGSAVPLLDADSLANSIAQYIADALRPALGRLAALEAWREGAKETCGEPERVGSGGVVMGNGSGSVPESPGTSSGTATASVDPYPHYWKARAGGDRYWRCISKDHVDYKPGREWLKSMYDSEAELAEGDNQVRCTAAEAGDAPAEPVAPAREPSVGERVAREATCIAPHKQAGTCVCLMHRDAARSVAIPVAGEPAADVLDRTQAWAAALVDKAVADETATADREWDRNLTEMERCRNAAQERVRVLEAERDKAVADAIDQRDREWADVIAGYIGKGKGDLNPHPSIVGPAVSKAVAAAVAERDQKWAAKLTEERAAEREACAVAAETETIFVDGPYSETCARQSGRISAAAAIRARGEAKPC